MQRCSEMCNPIENITQRQQRVRTIRYAVRLLRKRFMLSESSERSAGFKALSCLGPVYCKLSGDAKP